MSADLDEKGGAQAPPLFRNSQVIPMHLRVSGVGMEEGTAERKCNACAQKLLWSLDLSGSLGGWVLLCLSSSRNSTSSSSIPAGEEGTTVVSCVPVSPDRILATPGDPADMSVSVPLGGPAVLDWGQHYSWLFFVLLVSLCIKNLFIRNITDHQRRSGYEVDPQPSR